MLRRLAIQVALIAQALCARDCVFKRAALQVGWRCLRDSVCWGRCVSWVNSSTNFCPCLWCSRKGGVYYSLPKKHGSAILLFRPNTNAVSMCNASDSFTPTKSKGTCGF